MRIPTGLATALLLLFTGSAHAAAPAATSAAKAPSAEELVARNIEARGGLEALRALQSLRTTGKLRFGGDGGSFELAYTTLTKRGKHRNEASLQGLTAIRAFDGAQAWQVSPFQGRKDPEKLSADEARPLARAGDLEGPLVDSARKGHKVQYLGTEDVDGTEAHKLRVTLKDGDTQDIYLDPDHFLEIRVVTRGKVRGVEVEEETDLGNYEKVGGVYIPFSEESGPKGGRKSRKVTLEKAEPNIPLDDALFHFPAVKTATAR